MRRSALLAITLALGCTSTAQAFVIRAFYPEDEDTWTPQYRAVVHQAISDWTSRMAFEPPNDQRVDIHFRFFSGGTGTGVTLAQWSYSPSHVSFFPYSTTLTHYISVNEDFLPHFWTSLDEPAPSDGYDMLTILRHELGHALGIVPSVYYTSPPYTDKWSRLIIGGIFDPGGLHVPMAADRAHLNIPDDLMHFSLTPGTRKAISETDLQMLSRAYGYTVLPPPVVPEPAGLCMLLLGSTALLTRRRRSSIPSEPMASRPRAAGSGTGAALTA